MHVATQTIHTQDRSTQAPSYRENINIIISERTVLSHNENRINYKLNSIMNQYYKKLNEKGHPITVWRNNPNVHKDLAIETIAQLQNIGESPPFWLVKRSLR